MAPSSGSSLPNDRASAAVDGARASTWNATPCTANGAVATAPTLPVAAVRAWFLEERARVALAAGGAALATADLEERARHYPAELERAWSWLRWRYGEEGR